jgi:hypothetical protein
MVDMRIEEKDNKDKGIEELDMVDMRIEEKEKQNKDRGIEELDMVDMRIEGKRWGIVAVFHIEAC